MDELAARSLPTRGFADIGVDAVAADDKSTGSGAAVGEGGH
jgi:hypothetical protein